VRGAEAWDDVRNGVQNDVFEHRDLLVGQFRIVDPPATALRGEARTLGQDE